MEIRPLRAGDVPAVNEVIRAALPLPPEWDEDDGASREAWLNVRTAHLLEHDGPGCWVAEDDDGAITGAAMAIVRDGLWGLSMLAVDPLRHARGTGGRLLDAALTYAEGTRGGLICSSPDPKAMRLYARAGFDLRPCVALAGIPDRSAIPAGLRAAPSADYEAAAAIGRAVRGGAYGPEDLRMVSERDGFGMLAVAGRGFAIHHPEGSPAMLLATDDDAALDLFWSCLAAGGRGNTVHVDFVMAGHDWCVQAGLEARLALSPEGPFFTRGALGPLRAFLPSGALL